MNILHLKLCIIFIFVSSDFITTAQETPFDQNYSILQWGGDHVTILDQGKEVQIKIDEYGGGGTKSKQSYTFGIFHQKIKMPKLSAGVATTIYLTTVPDGGSGDEAHTELDIEFLGHNGPPYTLSTNIYNDDKGGREQQFLLWFDPTSDFHDYKILWNQYQIVFYVDEIPIRIFMNLTKVGVKYPIQPMYVHTSVWNLTEWLGPVNWSMGPFYANFCDFAIEGCLDRLKDCESSNYIWNAARFQHLDLQQQNLYKTIRSKSMTYDYCNGGNSNNFPECKFI